MRDELTQLLRVVRAKVEKIRTAPEPNDAWIERELTVRIEAKSHGVLLRAADLNPPRIVGGNVHRRVGRAVVICYMATRPVTQRSINRAADGQDDRTIDPVSLRLDMVGGGWLPSSHTRTMAFLVQQGTVRGAATVSEPGRLPCWRARFGRVALYQQHAETTEQALIEAYRIPEATSGIALSLDRVCVPVEEPRPHPPGHPRKGGQPVQRVFQQVYCATVTLHYAEGEALHTIRYGRIPAGDVKGLCEGVCDDLLAPLAARPTLTVRALCDGAHELWGLVAEHLGAVAERAPIRELIDLWLLLEKLGAAWIHHDAAAAVARWHTSLLNHSASGAKIASWDQKRVTIGEEVPMRKVLSFRANPRECLDHAAARDEGRRVGGGAVEATCKNLIAVRLERPDARWKQPSADRIIQLRALALSDQWGNAIELTLGHQRREVRMAA